MRFCGCPHGGLLTQFFRRNWTVCFLRRNIWVESLDLDLESFGRCCFGDPKTTQRLTLATRFFCWGVLFGTEATCSILAQVPGAFGPVAFSYLFIHSKKQVFPFNPMQFLKWKTSAPFEILFKRCACHLNGGLMPRCRFRTEPELSPVSASSEWKPRPVAPELGCLSAGPRDGWITRRLTRPGWIRSCGAT